MKAIKEYHSKNHSVSSGQVLTRPYKFTEARLIVHEMADQLALDLFRKNVVCDQINVALCYDRESDLSDYDGPLCKDHYGKKVPKPVNGTFNLDRQTASSKIITEAALRIFDSIAHRGLLVRKVTI